MLAAYLIRQRGLAAEQAIASVRERKPGAIEVPERVETLAEYEEWVRGK